MLVEHSTGVPRVLLPLQSRQILVKSRGDCICRDTQFVRRVTVVGNKFRHRARSSWNRAGGPEFLDL